LKSDDVVYDLKIPLFFLVGIIILKLAYNYFYTYCELSIAFGRKEIQSIYISLCSFFKNHSESGIIKYSEYFRDYLIIIGTYFIIVFTRAINKNKIIFDNSHWEEYENALKSASNVCALNVFPVEKFFEPTGFRYFLGQIIEMKNRSNIDLNISRVVIIPEGDTYKESWIKNYNPASNDMNNEYRVFHNFVELHKLHGIKLYFATRNEVRNFLQMAVEEKRKCCDRFPIKIYYLLFIFMIIPIARILRPVKYAIKKIFISRLYFEDLDLLKINNSFFAPKLMRNKTIFVNLPEDNRTLQANNIMVHFSSDDEREANNLFFNHK
jgi:hypothetical protein